MVGAIAFGLVAAVYAGLYMPDWVAEAKPRYRGCGKRSCIANLKQIHGAILQWAVETKRTGMDRYTVEDRDLLAYLKGSMLPLCPQGGEYYPGIFVDAVPLCTLGSTSEYDHEIEMPKQTIAEIRNGMTPRYRFYPLCPEVVIANFPMRSSGLPVWMRSFSAEKMGKFGVFGFHLASAHLKSRLVFGRNRPF